MIRHTYAAVIAWIVLAGLGHAADVKTITRGKKVDLAAHLAPGKLTLVDFYAKWCGACRQLEPRIQKLAKDNEDVLAVRKVDVVDWNSPVARQFSIQSLPRLELFGADGKRIAAGSANKVLRQLNGAISEQRARLGDPPAAAAPVASAERPVGDTPPWLALAGVILLLTMAGGLWHWRRGATSTVGADGSLWYVERPDALDGPYSAADLARLRRDGRIDDTTPVCRKRDAQRMLLGEALSPARSS